MRRIAQELNLVTAHKRDSQGICFVGKVDLPVFLQQKLEPKKGRVFVVENDCELFKRDWSKALVANPSDEDLDKLAEPYDLHPKYGKKVGDHNGAHFYTIRNNFV